ncbi:MAG: aconitase family protein, partial [Betaproteobacteria bacterium]
TSCTNTSNPASMLAAGLLARNACARGLSSRAWVKTSLSPGSRVVADYLEASGLQDPLDALGFHLTGFGCMTCAGNSGPLAPELEQAIQSQGLAVAAVLSGNRNFEGRIHPSIRANFLGSPALVVAYAIAGTVLIDLQTEPLGQDSEGRDVYLADLWPEQDELAALTRSAPTTELFERRRASLLDGPAGWSVLPVADGARFAWREGSTFIRRPPFFDQMGREPQALQDILGARMLALFGDMLTTDHISPIGDIGAESPAGRYLSGLGIASADFVNYGARRLNHDVMVRGTFANVRLRNRLTPARQGSSTLVFPEGEPQSIHDAAMRYQSRGVPLVVVAGAEYGAGSSRDWAAKGTRLLGVRAVIAESYERIHRSNLIGMGVLPLQFAPGVNAQTLSLTGREVFDVVGIRAGIEPRAQLQCTVHREDGSAQTIALLARLDTTREVQDYCHGGLLHRLVRQRLSDNTPSLKRSQA